MEIYQIDSYRVRLPLRSPFKTSYGYLTEKAFDLLVITDELGNQGLGELLPFEQPDYIEETLATARMIVTQHLIPLLTKEPLSSPEAISERFSVVKGNEMAKASLETAIWDLYAKRKRQSLTAFFGETRQRIPVGVSVGIQLDLNLLLEQVRSYVALGYQRVKLKIQPGYDLAPVAFIRQHFPQLELMVDGNSAYTVKDIPHLQQLDSFHLAMIEQPFAANDFLDHSALQKKINTRICLDENIRSLKDCQLAYTLKSCQSINLKIPRVGGITEALKIVRFCQEKELLVWLGGMFESGVGRALNLQFASQIGLPFPGDISASDRYFFEDVITQPFKLENGQLQVPSGVGIGVELNQAVLNQRGQARTLYTKVLH